MGNKITVSTENILHFEFFFYSSLHYMYSISLFYFHLIMTFWKCRNVVLCFIIFYRRFLLSNVLPNLYLFEFFFYDKFLVSVQTLYLLLSVSVTFLLSLLWLFILNLRFSNLLLSFFGVHFCSQSFSWMRYTVVRFSENWPKRKVVFVYTLKRLSFTSSLLNSV